MINRRYEVLWLSLGAITVFCLMAITAVVVKREFFPVFEEVVARSPDVTTTTPGGSQQSIRPSEPPVPVANWEEVSRTGHRIGSANARVTMVVFSDFQCPYCARLATKTWPELRSRFGDDLAMLFRHWPIPKHAKAYDFAKGAECAASQGAFESYHDAVFSSQPSLQEKTPSDVAIEAGVKDIEAFRQCTTGSSRNRNIDLDAAMARSVGGPGTPTIVINGLRIRPPYSTEAIGSWIEAAINNVEK